jgi:hypothetical protein
LLKQKNPTSILPVCKGRGTMMYDAGYKMQDLHIADWGFRIWDFKKIGDRRQKKDSTEGTDKRRYNRKFIKA